MLADFQDFVKHVTGERAEFKQRCAEIAGMRVAGAVDPTEKSQYDVVLSLEQKLKKIEEDAKAKTRK